MPTSPTILFQSKHLETAHIFPLQIFEDLDDICSHSMELENSVASVVPCRIAHANLKPKNYLFLPLWLLKKLCPSCTRTNPFVSCRDVVYGICLGGKLTTIVVTTEVD